MKLRFFSIICLGFLWITSFTVLGQAGIEFYQNGKLGLKDKEGKILLDPIYNRIGLRWGEGLLAVRKGDFWGYVDSSQIVVIPFEYSYAEAFSEGLAFVSKDYDNCGFINKYNQVIIPFKYRSHFGCASQFNVESFNNGLAVVCIKNGPYPKVKCGMINKQGKTVIPFKYNCLNAFDKGYAFFRINDPEETYWYRKIIKYGYINAKGKEYSYSYPNNLAEYPFEIGQPPQNLPDSSGLFQNVVQAALAQFSYETVQYPLLRNMNRVTIAHGLLFAGGTNYERITSSYNWHLFKKYSLLKIASEETLRMSFFDWIFPYYKKAFKALNPFQKKSYKEIALYLKNYINTYDSTAVEAYLKRDEPKFAYYDRFGNYDPNRKIAAFVDRLILIHKVISVEDAKRWINKIANEVLKWK